MASELMVISPKSIEEAERLSKTLSTSQLLPDALKQKPADILATVLAGAELGLAPMQAIRGIAIIKGKPTLAADTMGALVKRRTDVCEYLVLKHSDGQTATYETKRRGDPQPTTMSFTIRDAQVAGLVSEGGMYRKYPAQMLRARCLAAICRAVYPDLCLGLYDPDELGAPVEPPPSVNAEPRDVTPTNGAARTPAEMAQKLKDAGLVEEAEVVPEPPPPTDADAPNVAPPDPHADAPPPEEDPVIGFGSSKGKRVSELKTKRDVEWHLKVYRERAADPKREPWKADNLGMVRALERRLGP